GVYSSLRARAAASRNPEHGGIGSRPWLDRHAGHASRTGLRCSNWPPPCGPWRCRWLRRRVPRVGATRSHDPSDDVSGIGRMMRIGMTLSASTWNFARLARPRFSCIADLVTRLADASDWPSIAMLNDRFRAELGSVDVRLVEAAKTKPVLGADGTI